MIRNFIEIENENYTAHKPTANMVANPTFLCYLKLSNKDTVL